jgi:rare lipoprotein A (peptidoglycan hydrolase)
VNATPHRGLRKPALALSLAAAAAVPAIAPASADAASIKLKTSHDVLLGKTVKVRGLLSTGAGQSVRIVRTKGHGWKTVARVNTTSGGRFQTRFPARNLGRMKIRVVGPQGAQSGVRMAAVYRRASASYYGPGLYGNKLACGGTLQPGTIGVANKTLPCGTKVRLHYRGHTVIAPVVDRGPYAAGRVYDLTEATKNRLRFGSTGMVWSTK